MLENWRKYRWLSVENTRKADTDIILNKNSDIIFKNKKISNKFNEYYKSMVESLDLHIWTDGSTNVSPSYTSDDGIELVC